VRTAHPETWSGIARALRGGRRGLRGGMTLRRLIEKKAGVKFFKRPELTEETILAWIDEHHRIFGKWPNSVSGPVHSCPDETWANINQDLVKGLLFAGLPIRLPL